MRKNKAHGIDKEAAKLKRRIALFEKQRNDSSIPQKMRDAMHRPGSMKKGSRT